MLRSCLFALATLSLSSTLQLACRSQSWKGTQHLQQTCYSFLGGELFKWKIHIMTDFNYLPRMIAEKLAWKIVLQRSGKILCFCWDKRWLTSWGTVGTETQSGRKATQSPVCSQLFDRGLPDLVMQSIFTDEYPLIRESVVDFSTGDDPCPMFKLQKEYNAPGKSPPLYAEFYTGWLTHWGENIVSTGADFTAAALDKILSLKGSAVLFMAQGGTNFGFYNGAHTGADEFDYKPDLTSYDYDAPIRESGDVDNAKFKALQRRGYGPIQLQRIESLFDLIDKIDPILVVESENPTSMESVGQMFGFLLYTSGYAAKDQGSNLFIPNVHDRAQVFMSCPSEDNGGRPTYVGTIERWSNQNLIENMGRVNYGSHLFDQKGILAPVYLDGNVLKSWKTVAIPFQNLNEVLDIKPIKEIALSRINKTSALMNIKNTEEVSIEPALYAGRVVVDETKDTFISFSGWAKGIAFVNEFNIRRFWPSTGPQCNLYVPAPVLRHGENNLLVVHSVDHPYFTCHSSSSSLL
ncbi:hypothetical protein PVL29_019540 [Vitis rotundifolia]|uniref:beta-galactosidase n=1 Tax=Vitis rotundifolia TaxID=103349 RepID=A0AA39DCU0_VITRO|nr:hypothetical protein PVL29_019540 [Vitis rotundifolia]